MNRALIAADLDQRWAAVKLWDHAGCIRVRAIGKIDHPIDNGSLDGPASGFHLITLDGDPIYCSFEHIATISFLT